MQKIEGITMDNKQNECTRKCFIITPIGDENSETFRKAKGVIESVIKPVLKEYGFDDIKPAYEINVSGMINTQIINRIIEDDLVIANLTGNNPNVMYELCLRHVVAKPIIHICENGTTLPFDIKDSRTIFYTNDMFGVEELKNSMNLFMEEISYNEDYMDNPIYNAHRYGKLLKETQGTESNEILRILMDISSKLSEKKTVDYVKLISPSHYAFNDDVIENKESAYTLERFYKELSEIDMANVQNMLENESDYTYRKRVHELAKELDTSIRLLMHVGKKIGINLKSASSAITSNEQKAMLNYMIQESKPKG